MKLLAERILITGGHGFVGRYLQAEFRCRDVNDLILPRRADYDLTIADHVSNLYRDLQPTVVIHLAAEVGGIGANQANPGRFFYANMAMGLHLIEHARRHGIKKFVQLGTVCAYPKHCPVPFHERDLWKGYPEETNAPYGVAKKALLVMLQAYRQQYNLNGIYLLPVNLYGPGDHFNLETSHVIPAMIRKFVDAKAMNRPEVELWGTGKASRDFLFVEDAARAIVDATERYDSPEPVNLGAGLEISMYALARKIQAIVGYEGRVVWDTSRPDGQPRRQVDTSRARRAFGWRAETSLDEGLMRTINWYKAKAKLA